MVNEACLAGGSGARHETRGSPIQDKCVNTGIVGCEHVIHAYRKFLHSSNYHVRHRLLCLSKLHKAKKGWESRPHDSSVACFRADPKLLG